MSQKLPQPTAKHLAKHRRFHAPIALFIITCAGATVYYYSSPATEQEPRAESHSGGREHGHGHGRDDDNKPVVVAIETAKQGDFPVYLNGLGAVTALKTVTVHSRVDGELKNVAFSEGQMVKEGDLLAEIDPRPFQVQLQQAEGQLMRDAALLKNAEIDVGRYQTLLEQDSIPAQQTMTQQALVKQFQGTVEMDQSQVNNAKLQLTYARLTAPIAGRVGLRQIDQGNIMHAGDTNGLVVITQLQPISVVFTLPEDKIQALMQRWRNDKMIEVSAYDRAGKTKLATGKLTAIDNQIDTTTGTLKLKAQFDNNESILFANQFVNVKMRLDTLTGVTLVPSAAIQHDTQGPFVYVINQEKTAEIRHINLGPNETEDAMVAVLSNLAANEVVVVEGTDRLKAGSRIDIAQKDGQAVAANPDAPGQHERKFDGKHRKPAHRS
jgi:multidrug efflux system membrane fusion protein